MVSELSIALKKKIVRTAIYPFLLYGCETWTLRKEEIKKLEACEIWMWRKLLKVKWSDRKTIEEFRRIINEPTVLVVR